MRSVAFSGNCPLPLPAHSLPEYQVLDMAVLVYLTLVANNLGSLDLILDSHLDDCLRFLTQQYGNTARPTASRGKARKKSALAEEEVRSKRSSSHVCRSRGNTPVTSAATTEGRLPQSGRRC
jgi:hypothetical protein